MIGLGLEETLLQYLRAVGWSVTAAVGFAFGVGIALKVFDWLSTDIDEWEEIIPDPEYGIFVIAVLNNIRNDKIINKILDAILNIKDSKEETISLVDKNIEHPFC